MSGARTAAAVRILEPDRLDMAELLQIPHHAENGHVAAGALREIRHDPVQNKLFRVVEAVERREGDGACRAMAGVSRRQRSPD